MNTVIFVAALMASGYMGLKAFNLYVKHKMLPVLIKAGEQIVYGGYSEQDLSPVITQLNSVAGKWFGSVRSKEKSALGALLKAAQELNDLILGSTSYSQIDSAIERLIHKFPSLKAHQLGYFCGIESAYQAELDFRQEREYWDQQYFEEADSRQDKL